MSSVEFLRYSTRSPHLLTYAKTTCSNEGSMETKQNATERPVDYADYHQLINRLQELKSALAALRRATLLDAEAGYPALVYVPPAETLHPEVRFCHPWHEVEAFQTSFKNHELALLGVENIWFDDRANSRRTFDFPGVVICSQATIEQVELVNQAKTDFKDCVLALKEKYADLTDSNVEEELFYREKEWATIDSVKKAFQKAQIARICVKQVYRHIQTICDGELLRAKPYYNPKEITRVRTVKKQLTLLDKKAKAKIKQGETPSQALINAIEQLREMDQGAEIAERHEPYEVITLNYKVKTPGSDGAKWKQLYGQLPVFCAGSPTTELTSLIDFDSLSKSHKDREEARQQKAARVDQVWWEDTPFNDAFNLYRPLPERAEKKKEREAKKALKN